MRQQWFPIMERKYNGLFRSMHQIRHTITVQGNVVQLSNTNYIGTAYLLTVKPKKGPHQHYVLQGTKTSLYRGGFVLEGFSHQNPDSLDTDVGAFHRTEWSGPLEAIR